MLLLAGALRVPALGQALFHLPPIEAHQLHQGHIAKEPARQCVHRLAPKEHFEQVQQHKRLCCKNDDDVVIALSSFLCNIVLLR